MNPFEAARLRAHDVRRILLAHGVTARSKGPLLIAAAAKTWRLAIRRVPPKHPLLGDADAKIKIKQRWIVVRDDLSAAMEAFLVAHEIGHFLLHHGGHSTFAVSAAALEAEADGSAAVRYVEAYGPRERQELQANVFARELLLPRAMARELFIEESMAASEIASDFELTAEVVHLQLFDALLLPELPSAPVSPIPEKPTEAQRAAVDSPHRYTLVEAGPGTGKTTTLLLRLRQLLAHGADAAGIVVLTFSNKAARELVERLKTSGIAGADRVWVGTFHSFGLEFLRKFGQLCGLKPQVHLLDEVAAFGVMEALLPQLPLRSFDPLADPIGWLPDALRAIARCKDELIDPATFRAAIAREPDEDPALQARRLDVADLYDLYERTLSTRHAVDLKDLLVRTIQLLEGNDTSIEIYVRGLKHILVDEYQDVNRASARLVRALARYADTVWAVGDAHQAVYAFMGASSRNLADFTQDFPGAQRIPLAGNHRSSQEIADTFFQLSQRGPGQTHAHHLKAAKGSSGLRPQLVTCEDATDELDVLAARIQALKPRAPFGSQAVLAFSNDAATAIAQGLERRGIPVLFLGSLYERPDIKDLLCLLHLSVDEKGAGLGRDWNSGDLAVPYDDVRVLLAQAPTAEGSSQPWWERDRGGLSEAGRLALNRLDEMTSPLRGVVSPWDALCVLLLEDGRMLRALAGEATQAAVNSRLAIWQFVHSCRTPDALAPYATVRNLFGRIARRMRLGADKHLRHVPPEAEGLDAVRVLTVHVSKGLEFDAVHLLEAEGRVYEPKSRQQRSVIPPSLLAQSSAMDEELINRTERHNLLYVALSRARAYLTVFKQQQEDLPSALEGLCQAAEPAQPKIPWVLPPRPRPSERITEVSLETLAGSKNGCPRRAEFTRRVGRVSSGALPAHRRLDIAQSRVLRALAADVDARAAEAIPVSIEAELRAVELWESEHRAQIVQRLQSVAQTAAALYGQGGSTGDKVPLRIDPLQVIVTPNQLLQSHSGTTLRIFHTRDSQSANWGKQALGALLKTHRQATGESIRAEFIALGENGRSSPATNVKDATVRDYESMAAIIAAGSFPAKPSSRACPSCPYLLLCDQGRS
jgi:superfamily I DNA/RNA helicase